MLPMLEQSKLWIEHLAGGVEIAAAVIIGLAAAEAVWKASPLFLRRGLAARHQSGGQAQSGPMAGSGAGVRVGGRYSSHGGRSDLAGCRPARFDRRASYRTKLLPGTGDCTRRRKVPHLCSPGQFRLASSMCFGIASDHVFFTPLL
jgi:hypothetical protein